MNHKRPPCQFKPRVDLLVRWVGMAFLVLGMNRKTIPSKESQGAGFSRVLPFLLRFLSRTSKLSTHQKRFRGRFGVPRPATFIFRFEAMPCRSSGVPPTAPGLRSMTSEKRSGPSDGIHSQLPGQGLGSESGPANKSLCVFRFVSVFMLVFVCVCVCVCLLFLRCCSLSCFMHG